MPRHVNNWKEHWDRKKSSKKYNNDAGKVIVSRQGSRVQVAGPFNLNFITGARKLNGKWRRRSGIWSFDVSVLKEIKTLTDEIYGAENVHCI